MMMNFSDGSNLNCADWRATCSCRSRHTAKL